MAPNITKEAEASSTNSELPEKKEENASEKQQATSDEDIRRSIDWKGAVSRTLQMITAAYALWLLITSANQWTSLWVIVSYELGTLAVHAGVERLWAQRSYEARFPLRLFLVLSHSMAFREGVALDRAQEIILKKGGKMRTKKREEAEIAQLYADPILRFHKKLSWIVKFLACFVFPTALPMYAWQEQFANAFFANVLRCLVKLYADRSFDSRSTNSEQFFSKKLATVRGWQTNIFIETMKLVRMAYDEPLESVRRRIAKSKDDSTPEEVNKTLMTRVFY